MKVLLIGPPGSGKGTQGEALANRLQLRHIAAGDLLRAEIAAGTDLGRRVAGMLERGELVPDQTIVELVMPVVASAAAHGGYLCDGFPRTVAQVTAAQAWTSPAGAPDVDVLPDAVIVLDVPDEVLVARIAARGRSDDTEDVVRHRLRVYAEQTEPLLGLYRERGLLHMVDGSLSVADVSDAILAELDVPRA